MDIAKFERGNGDGIQKATVTVATAVTNESNDKEEEDAVEPPPSSQARPCFERYPMRDPMLDQLVCEAQNKQRRLVNNNNNISAERERGFRPGQFVVVKQFK